MAEAKRQESEMETTESYRGPVREISSVERLYAPANDNKPKTKNRTPAPGASGRVPNVPLKTRAADKISVPLSLVQRFIGGVALLVEMITATVWIYIIQIFFGVLSLVGYMILGGIETSGFFSAADIVLFGSATEMGAGLFLLGGVGAALCGFVTYLIALSMSKTSKKFLASGKGKTDMFGPLVVTACLVALLCPVVNLFPVMWLWCLYATLFSRSA